MKARCSNPKNSHYQHYGARGIKVCSRWHSFKTFIEDMGRRPQPGMTIEREDNDKGYCPENCRWATQLEQMRNVRKNRKFLFQGKMLTIRAIAELTGKNFFTLKGRLMLQGLSLEEALSKPFLAAGKQSKILLTFKERTQSLVDWARELNINHHTLRDRIKRMGIEEALTLPVDQNLSRSLPKIRIMNGGTSVRS
jgi:hypothetical protein